MNITQPADGPFTDRMGGGGPMLEFDACSDTQDWLVERSRLRAAERAATLAVVVPLRPPLCARHADYMGVGEPVELTCEACWHGYFDRLAVAA